MIKIIITNEKGGTGKSTITCLLTEYLNYLGKKVQLIDTDPLQISQGWANNCLTEGRQISFPQAEYQVVDTAGSSGSSLAWIRQADHLIVPFRPHYADLQVTINWFLTLNKELQRKIFFLPNHWQNTKEQREGIKYLQGVITEQKAGILLKPLTNRPALYGILLNGSATNFFSQENVEEAQNLFQTIFNHIQPNQIQ